jgi:ABC-type sugar transport system permease subunit
MILIAVVAAYPIIYAVWLSLARVQRPRRGPVALGGAVGLRNYQTALQSEWWAAFSTRSSSRCRP